MRSLMCLLRRRRHRLPHPLFFASSAAPNHNCGGSANHISRESRRCLPPPGSASTSCTSTRGWSSSGFTAGDHTGATEMRSLPSAFPWREAPDNINIRGLAERAMYSALQQQHRRFLRAASRMNDVLDDEAFLVREKQDRNEAM